MPDRLHSGPAFQSTKFRNLHLGFLGPCRHRVFQLAGGEFIRIDRAIFAILNLHQNTAREHILTVLAELDALVGDDQLGAGNVRLGQRLADFFRIRRAGPVNGVGERNEPGKGAVRDVGEITEIIDLANERNLRGEAAS